MLLFLSQGANCRMAKTELAADESGKVEPPICGTLKTI